MKRSLARLTLLCAVMAPGEAAADPLLGDTGGALSSAQGADVNPANAGFMDRSEIQISPELFGTESLQIRYPNFEPVSQDQSGIGNLLSMGKPAFIYKLTSKLGIGGYAVPPLGLSTDIHKSRIPVVILNTLNYVDLDAKGTLDGAFALTGGYRFNDKFGVGLNVNYQAISFDAKLKDSDSGSEVASIQGSSSDFNIGTGLRYDPAPGRVAFGVAFGLMNMHQESIKFDSSLLSAAPEDGSASPKDDGTEVQVVNPLSSVLVGMQISNSTMRFLADAEYTRVNKEAKGFSIVDLREKRKDLYDTVAVRLGAILNIMDGGDALVGFRYEPASLGPGSRSSGDDDGTLGFGTQELIMVFAGLEPLVPYWQLGLGVKLAYGRHKTYDTWTYSAGLVYRRASLGIDENGEQPGAYLYQKTFVPLTVTYKF